VAFSSDAEHIVAGTTPNNGQYQLCIWSSTGAMLQQVRERRRLYRTSAAVLSKRNEMCTYWTV
jgi:hypothetical protein